VTVTETLDLLIVATVIGVILGLVATLATVLMRYHHEWIADRWDGIEAIWKPKLLGALTDEADAPVDLNALEYRDRPFVTDLLVRFLRRLLGPERDRLRALAPPLLPPLRRAARSWSAPARAKAMDAIGLLSPVEDEVLLRKALDDPSPLVAMVAARALTRSGRSGHAEVLLAHLHRFEGWRASYLAAMLAAIGAEMVKPLLALYGDHSAPASSRTVAADALTRLNAVAAADIAVAALKETSPELRAASLRLLRRLGRGEHLDAVRTALDASEDAVRLAAVRAVVALGGDREIPSLVWALSDQSTWVAQEAAKGLAAGAGRVHLVALEREGGNRALIAREALGERPA
jgi:HEAT repeat protein